MSDEKACSFDPVGLLSPLGRASNLSLRSLPPTPATPSQSLFSPRRCRASTAAAGALFASLASPVQRLSPEARRSLESSTGGGESLSPSDLAALEAELEADLAKQTAMDPKAANGSPETALAVMHRRLIEADAALLQAGVTGAALLKEMEEMDEEYAADCERKEAQIAAQTNQIERMRVAMAAAEISAQADRDELARQKDAFDALCESLAASQARAAALEAEIKSMAGARNQAQQTVAHQHESQEFATEREGWIATRTALEERIECLTTALSAAKDELAQSQSILQGTTSVAQDLSLATAAFQAAEANILVLQASLDARNADTEALRTELEASQVRAQTVDQASTIVLARLNQRIAELEEINPSAIAAALSESQRLVQILESLGLPLWKLHLSAQELGELSVEGVVQLARTLLPSVSGAPVCTPAEAVVFAQNETDALLREISQSVAQSLTVQASARKTRRSSSMSAIGQAPLAVLQQESSAQIVPLCIEMVPIAPVPAPVTAVAAAAPSSPASPARSDLLREYFHLCTLLLKLSPNALVSDPTEQDLQDASDDSENVDPLSSPCASPSERKVTSNVRASNYPVQKLWEECQASAVPFEQWHRWIASRLEQEAARAGAGERLRPRNTPAGSKHSSNAPTPLTRSRAPSIGSRDTAASSFATPLASSSASASAAAAYARVSLTPISIGNLSKIVVEPQEQSEDGSKMEMAPRTATPMKQANAPLGENTRVSNAGAQQQQRPTPMGKQKASAMNPTVHRPVIRGAASDRFNQRQPTAAAAAAASSKLAGPAASPWHSGAAPTTPSRSLLGKFANFVTASPAPRAASPSSNLRQIR